MKRRCRTTHFVSLQDVEYGLHAADTVNKLEEAVKEARELQVSLGTSKNGSLEIKRRGERTTREMAEMVLGAGDEDIVKVDCFGKDAKDLLNWSEELAEKENVYFLDFRFVYKINSLAISITTRLQHWAAGNFYQTLLDSSVRARANLVAQKIGGTDVKPIFALPKNVDITVATKGNSLFMMTTLKVTNERDKYDLLRFTSVPVATAIGFVGLDMEIGYLATSRDHFFALSVKDYEDCVYNKEALVCTLPHRHVFKKTLQKEWFGIARCVYNNYIGDNDKQDQYCPFSHKEEIHANYNIAPNKFATFVDDEAIRVSCNEGGKTERKAHPKGKGMVVLEVPPHCRIINQYGETRNEYFPNETFSNHEFRPYSPRLHKLVKSEVALAFFRVARPVELNFLETMTGKHHAKKDESEGEVTHDPMLYSLLIAVLIPNLFVVCFVAVKCRAHFCKSPKNTQTAVASHYLYPNKAQPAFNTMM